MAHFPLVALCLLVASGSGTGSSHEWDRRSQYQPDGSSSPDSHETPAQGATYYGGPPLWYYSSQNANTATGRTTRCSNRDGVRPKTAPQLNQATLQQVRGNHTRSPKEDYTRQLQFVGLQVADTAVEVPRLHGVVWGHPTRITGVGPVEHDETNGTSVPLLVPTPQAVWITNRHLPNGPDTGSASTSHKTSENKEYMAFVPIENKPLAIVPVKITDVNGKPDVLHLPVMPHLILQSLPDASSTYLFHHVAWLFWPASGLDPSRSSCPQRIKVPPMYMN